MFIYLLILHFLHAYNFLVKIMFPNNGWLGTSNSQCLSFLMLLSIIK